VTDANGQAGSLSYGIGAETVRVFAERFGKAGWEAGQERWMAARANLQHGRVEAALSAYHEAIERQPGNWMLLNEVAGFLIYTLRNPAAGVAMAKKAIELNPACSAVLWNTLGDAWFEMGKMPEAKGAYLRALRVNASDVQARYNLAWVYLNERRYQAALAVVAEALALDETGEYWERLVKKQNEILGRLQQRNQHKQFLLANRVSSKTAVEPANGVDTKR
jgi:tetratricopeptide (TPR) repeat protein